MSPSLIATCLTKKERALLQEIEKDPAPESSGDPAQEKLLQMDLIEETPWKPKKFLFWEVPQKKFLQITKKGKEVLKAPEI